MDKRIIKTRRLLGTALIDLLEKHPYKDITIRQITEYANVAYSTFFRNFESLDDLLLSHLQDFINTIELEGNITDQRRYREQSLASIRSLFEHVAQHEQMHRVLFNTPSAQPVLRTLQDNLTQHNIELFNSMAIEPVADSVPVELVMRASISQLISMIEWWLDNNLQPDVEQLARYHEQIVTIPMWHILLGEDEAFYRLGIPLSVHPDFED